MRKIAVAFFLLTLLTVAVSAQSTPTLRIVTDDPTLPSDLFYGNIKVKPLRLRPGTNVRITIDDSDFFVQQHYIDFLSRFPEQQGFQAWMNVLSTCNNDSTCLYGPSGKRILVSQSFFGSPEFNLKGGYVFRFYKESFARTPTYAEMIADMRSVTGQTSNEVYAKKAAFTNAFVQRPEFTSAYGAMSNADYVAALMGHYSLSQINTPDPAQPDGTNKVTLTIADLTSQLNANTLTRAQVLRAIADSDQVTSAEFNSSFVYMQYVGYLRREPEPAGYNAWLSYLNSHPGDFNTMVWGFVDSQEYRNRF